MLSTRSCFAVFLGFWALPITHAFAVGWSSIPASSFVVRGPTYLDEGSKKVKVPSEDFLYEVTAVNVFRVPHPIDHYAEFVGDYRRMVTSEVTTPKKHQEKSSKEDPSTLLPKSIFLNLDLGKRGPKDHRVFSHVFQLKPGYTPGQKPGLDLALSHFFLGSDEDMQQRLKFIYRIAEAPPLLLAGIMAVIRTAGGPAPILFANKIPTLFRRGPGYLEINANLTEGQAGRALWMVFDNARSITVDYLWLVEAKDKAELPENALMGLRWSKTMLSSVAVDLGEDGEIKGPL